MAKTEEGLTVKKARVIRPNTYQFRNNEGVKEEHRLRVVAYLIKHHTPRIPMRYFGLPGERCVTERLLSDKWAWSKFIGIERNWGTMERSMPWMPGKNPYFFEEEMRTGIIRGIRSSQARTVNFGCSAFLNLGRTDKRDKRHRHKFAAIYKNWSCFWLDTCANVGGELHDCLLRVDQWCGRDFLVVPFALTFQIGREGNFTAYLDEIEGSAIEKRVMLIEAILRHREYRRPVIDDAWTYRSDGGSQMGMVLGRLTLI